MGLHCISVSNRWNIWFIVRGMDCWSVWKVNFFHIYNNYIRTNIRYQFYRKISLLASGLIYLCGVLFFLRCRIVSSVELLLMARFIIGVASGLSTCTAPMYLAEISPPSLRGSFGTFFSVGLTTGIVIGQILSLEEVLGTAGNWHYAFSAFGLFNLTSLMLYRWIPESPKYLYVVAGHESNAKRGEIH